jgi:ATP-binding cassette subfamily F protein 3
VAIEDHRLNSYVGGWGEYARLREERKARGESPTSALPAPAPPPKPKAEPAKPKAAAANGKGNGAAAGKATPSPSKNRQREQAKLERAVEQAEAALASLEDELADPKAWATKYESAKSTARHTAAKRAVEDAYAQLEAFEASPRA